MAGVVVGNGLGGKSSLHVKEAGLKIQFQDGESDCNQLRSFCLLIRQNPFCY